jgi:hypothetical protein
MFPATNICSFLGAYFPVFDIARSKEKHVIFCHCAETCRGLGVLSFPRGRRRASHLSGARAKRITFLL